MSFNKQTPERYSAFLTVLADTGNVSRACEAVGICRFTAYQWRNEDPAFAERWNAAKNIGILGMEDEACRRAFEGVDEPVFHKGEPTFLFERDETGEIIYDIREETSIDPLSGDSVVIRHQKPRMLLDKHGNPKMLTKKGYSDTLAIFLMKGAMPEKYKDRVEHSGNIDIAQRIVAARKRTT